MSFYEVLRSVLGIGLEPKDLSVGQVCLRALIVFIATLIMVRLADRRFLSKMSAFDAVVGFIMASMLARAINGSAPFFPSLAAGAVLIALHRIIGIIAFHSAWFGGLVKGEAQVLAQNGKTDPTRLRSSKISEADLLEEARLNGKVQTLQQVQLATLERNGKVSVIPSEKSG